MLYAKLKGKQNEHRLLLAEDKMPGYDEFFPIPDLSQAEEYAPLQTEITPGSWFFVELDLEQVEEMVGPYMPDFGHEAPPIDQAEYYVVDTIYKVEQERIAFQRIPGAARIHENGKQHLSFGANDVSVERISFAIDFAGQVDAVYDMSSRRIYFQNFAKAKPIFAGFDVFHQDLTLDEKEAFLDNPLFDVGDFNLNFISLNDVRKIAAIRESTAIDIEDPDVQQRIRQYVQNYPAAGVTVGSDGRIMIGSRKELSALLKMLEQKYYTSELTGEKFLATSAKKMTK